MKPDAAEIGAFVEELARKPYLRGREHWPRHLFRIDGIEAAAAVLEAGRVYSRNRAVALGVLDHDAAAPGVIGNSPDWIKDCVRLYFRPRTPTEYRSEGVRPKAEWPMGAQRAVPVVMVFDSIPILTATGTSFTNGNAAARGVLRGNSVGFLRAMPFELVYHEGAMKESDKSQITFHRCAETIVSNDLDLEHLKHVLCRSQAEQETLLSLLSEDTRRRYSKLIGVAARVHYKRWTFLESVDLTNERITFRFSPGTQSPGPFHVVSEVHRPNGKLLARWEDRAFIASGVQVLRLGKVGNPDSYRVSLRLDGALVYLGTLKSKEALL